MVSLALVACGGGDDGDDEKAAPKGPTKQQDVAAIEQVLLAYGAADGSEVCSYYAESQIDATGGVAECESVNEDASAALFTVENVAVNGGEATAVVTVEGQEGEVSAYELSREGREWKISDFPSDDGPQTQSEPEPVIEEEAPEPLPPATPKVIITDLLTDFGKASGAPICDFFSVSFVEGQQGGRAGCENYFGDKPATNYKPVVVAVGSKTSARAILRNSSGRAYAQVDVTEPPDSLYGGWRVTEFQIQD